MSQLQDSRYIPVVTGDAIPKNTRVKFAESTSIYEEFGIAGDGRVVWEAGASDKSVGVTTRTSTGAGHILTVRLHRGGTSKVIADGAIDAGAEVYASANGHVASSGSVSEGFAMEAATLAGDIIEVMFHGNGV